MLHSDFKKGIYLVTTTEKDKSHAYKLAEELLKRKLIACVQFKNIESRFWWQGKINHSEEVYLIFKCLEENINAVCKKISEIHTYEVPEIIYFPVYANNDYFEWISSF